MKSVFSFLISLTLLLPLVLRAQVEKVIVETYYISDLNDSRDTTGGVLEPGSVTYRIYIDLAPGSKLTKIYGDATHAFKIASTASFFNNKADGQTFAKEFPKNRYQENTVALDSWLTLGQTTRIGAKTYYGILKGQDNDGSFIGGVNNDGGSTGNPAGLLINADPAAGIPLTTNDGMDTMIYTASNWGDYGIIDSVSHVDSTIFGSARTSSQFVSYNAGLQNSGIMGIVADSNQVLVAQLTTKGNISFELNLEVVEPQITHPVKYVAKLASGETTSDTLKLCPYLTYPLSCGCKDPNFLEYNPAYGCNIIDSCKTRIIYGCMDSMACNYDPTANFNVQSLCCYPGFCNDRDIGIICPSLSNGRVITAGINIFPNPAHNQVSLQVAGNDNEETGYAIYNSTGKLVLYKNLGVVPGKVIENIDISTLEVGPYLVRLYSGDVSESKILMKN